MTKYTQQNKNDFLNAIENTSSGKIVYNIHTDLGENILHKLIFNNAELPLNKNLKEVYNNYAEFNTKIDWASLGNNGYSRLLVEPIKKQS
jgi:hypothetical protein